AVPQHWHRQCGAETRLRETAVYVLGISGNVWHVGNGARQYGAGRDAAPARRYREDALDDLKVVGRIVMMGYQVDQAAVEPKDAAVQRLTQRDRSGGNGVKDRLDVCWGTREEAENLARRCL